MVSVFKHLWNAQITGNGYTLSCLLYLWITLHASILRDPVITLYASILFDPVIILHASILCVPVIFEYPLNLIQSIRSHYCTNNVYGSALSAKETHSAQEPEKATI